MHRGLIALLFVTCFSSSSARAQRIELQAYPAGVIGIVSFTFRHVGPVRASMHAGVNITDRRDWGEQDDESGYGFGAGIDVNRFLSDSEEGFWYGARVDFWSMLINWENKALSLKADSRILVFQPTARAGYAFSGLGRKIDLTLGLGVEKNIATHGENVGQGAILLAGLRLTI